jgi:hypothetical protein
MHAGHLLSLFEKEGILEWKLLNAVTMEQLRLLGVSMGDAIRLDMALRGTLERKRFNARKIPSKKFSRAHSNG